MDYKQAKAGIDLFTRKIEENPNDPANERRQLAIQKLEGLYKKDYARHSLENKLYAERGTSVTPRRAYQPYGFSDRNPKTLKGNVNKQFKADISNYTGVPIEQIDIETGGNIWDRLELGWLPSKEKRFDALVKNYSPEDVAPVPDGNDLKLMVREGDRWVLFDERAFTVRDIADLAREVPATALEVGGAVIAVQMTGGAAMAGNLGSWMNLLVGAAGAGVGRGVSTFTSDSLAEMASFGETNFGENILRSSKEGGEAAVYDMLFGTLGKYGGRLLKTPGRMSPQKEVDEMMKGIERISTELGEKAPITRAMYRDLPSMQVEASVAADAPKSQIARTYEQGRDMVLQHRNALITGKPSDIETHYRNAADRIAQNFKDAEIALLRASGAEQRALRGIAQEQIDRLGNPASGELALGEALQQQLGERLGAARASSNAMYDQVWESAGSEPVSVISVADKVAEVVNSLDLPKDTQGRLLPAFVSPQVKKASSQVEAILEPSGRPVGELTLKNIYDWRQSIRDVVSKAKKQGTHLEGMDEIYFAVDDLLTTEARRLGVAKQLDAAHANYKATVGPFKRKGFNDITSREFDRFLISGKGVNRQLFSGDRAIDNIRTYKEVAGDEAGMEAIRNAYAARLRASAMEDGKLSLKKLVNAVDEDILRELYGPQAIKNVKAAQGVLNRYSRASGDISLEALDEIMKSGPKDTAKLKAAIEQRILATERQERLLRDTIAKDLAETAGANSDALFRASPATTIDTLMSKGSPKMIEDFFEKLSPIEKKSFKVEAVKWLYDQAANSSSGLMQRASKTKGVETMWNYEALNNILSQKKTREIYEMIIGKETMNRIIDNNNALRAYTVRQLAPGKESSKTRMLANGNGIAYYVTVPFASISRRLMGIVDSSPTLQKLTMSTETTNNFAAEIFPIIAASDEGMRALIQESEKDPEFARYVEESLADIRNSVNK